MVLYMVSGKPHIKSTNVQLIIFLLMILIGLTDKLCSTNGEFFVLLPVVDVMMLISTGKTRLTNIFKPGSGSARLIPEKFKVSLCNLVRPFCFVSKQKNK